jgi:tripeptidyl-peptidase-1
MRCWSPLVALVLASAALGKLAGRWDDMAVKHAWAEVPRGWVSQGPAPPDHKMVRAPALRVAPARC